MTQPDQPTAHLAVFLADLAERGVPASVADVAKRHILDVLAGMFAGGTVPEMDTLLRQFVATTPGGTVVPTTPFRCALPVAAGAAAALSHAAESDPIDSSTAICAGAVTVPAVLAVCQTHPVSGARLLAAVAGGYEAGIRLGRAINSTTLLARGFWPTAVCGAVAASASAGVAMGLDAEKIRHALALAAVHGGGLATGGAEAPAARNLLCASTVRAGVDAALCARAGMVGAREAFDGDRGFLSAFAETPDATRITEPPGDRWAIEGASQKAWPCALQAQSAIDALKTVLTEGACRADDIDGITVALPAAMKRIVDRPGPPESHFSAAASLQFLCAALVLDGDIAPTRMGAEGRADNNVLALMQKVVIRHDAGLDARYPAEWPARVTVFGPEGERTHEVAAPPGHPSRPLSFAETADRLRSWASVHLDGPSCDAVIELVEGLAEGGNADELVALISPAHSV